MSSMRSVMDSSLEELGLVRVHIPRDGNSFFRCFADRLLRNQNRFRELRLELIHFSQRTGQRIRCSEDLIRENHSVPPAVAELAAHCFRTPVLLFRQKGSLLQRSIYDPAVGLVGAEDTEITDTPVAMFTYLFECEFQYDLILTMSQLQVAAMTQSLAYGALYAGVFGMGDTDVSAVLADMLQEKTFAKVKNQLRHLNRRSEDESLPPELERLPPVPYRVAKALDSSNYRNVPMDLWLEQERQTQQSLNLRLDSDLRIGYPCLISLPQVSSHKAVCFVASPTNGSYVHVFVPTLGKKVTYDVRQLQTLRPVANAIHQPSAATYCCPVSYLMDHCCSLPPVAALTPHLSLLPHCQVTNGIGLLVPAAAHHSFMLHNFYRPLSMAAFLPHFPHLPFTGATDMCQTGENPFPCGLPHAV